MRPLIPASLFFSVVLNGRRKGAKMLWQKRRKSGGQPSLRRDCKSVHQKSKKSKESRKGKTKEEKDGPINRRVSFVSFMISFLSRAAPLIIPKGRYSAHV